MTNTDLERTLRALSLRDISVRVDGNPGHLVAVVASPEFDGQEEFVRQQRVWGHLMNELTDEQRVEVEFVFTLTPDEARRFE